MNRGLWYRLSSIGGVICLTMFSVALVNNTAVQTAAVELPVLTRLPTDPPTGPEFTIELLLTAAVFVGVCLPMYKPRPRRRLDMIALAQKRILTGIFVLATIGYFDYSYKLPRLTVVLLTPLLLTAIPLWFVWIQQQPPTTPQRAIIVGDDSDLVAELLPLSEHELIGYLAPSNATFAQVTAASPVATDGGGDAGIERLGGLSRIEDVLVACDVDTVVLAFAEADRAEFFGVLDACYEHGVAVKAHRNHADAVLTTDTDLESLVDVTVEPWDVQDYLLKRGFDVAFAGVGLVLLVPVILAIAIAIKLEDGGSIFYTQERTALFGETFSVYKFRSMVENAEAKTGATISAVDAGGVDPRVTSVGRILRQTHLDEAPQLWSVLTGEMSVVGPRPERPELDSDIQAGVIDWQKRWFVKPGLTGPAQVDDVTGAEPDKKLRYDLEYVRDQSFRYDLHLVALQLWKVLWDASMWLRPDDS